MISAAAAEAGRRATAARLAAGAATLLQQAEGDSTFITNAQAATACALAASGLHVRAASLAASIADNADRAEAYAKMAEILMESGAHEKAEQFARQAETSAREEEDQGSRMEAMAQAAEGLACAGLYERAETLGSPRGAWRPLHLRTTC
jgi:hypothetical protein